MQPSSASLFFPSDPSAPQRASTLDETLDALASAPSGSRTGQPPPARPHELFRHLAHELRQPLSAMVAVAYYLDMILPESDARAREQVRKLRFLVEQANAILSDGNQIFQSTPARPELIDLDELLSNFIADTAWRDGAIDLRPADGTALVFIDSMQAQHLAGNLLRLLNRIGMPGAQITLATGSVAGEAWMEFATQAADCCASLWQELFDRPDPSGACGLGLAVSSVRRILDEHHGQISVHNDAGCRIRFVVTFPQAAQALALAATACP